ncbi:MAG: hypothetical protein JW771_08290, partial [Candidatus Thermoplasmatota archaeon]|nr:hypothetical protein [Candidatus Thermoplasmatota archaeon]
MTILLKKTKITLATLAVAMVVAGCGHNTLQEKNNLITNSNAYNAAKNQQTSYVAKSRNIMQRPARASFVDSTVYYAVSQVAKSLDVEFDQTFRPSSDYRITVNFEGSLGEFLHMIYIETGIKYKYRNGILSVFNKKDVDESHKIAQCKNNNPPIMVALDDVLPMEFFKFMSDKYNMSFRFDNKFYGLKGSTEEGKDIKPKISFYYKGCDKDEALREFARTADLKIENSGKDKYVVSDYD